MLYHRFWLRSLLVLGLIGLFGVPSYAQNRVGRSSTTQDSKKKDGDPPRPKPAPGPREGGDGD